MYAASSTSLTLPHVHFAVVGSGLGTATLVTLLLVLLHRRGRGSSCYCLTGRPAKAGTESTGLLGAGGCSRAVACLGTSVGGSGGPASSHVPGAAAVGGAGEALAACAYAEEARTLVGFYDEHEEVSQGRGGGCNPNLNAPT